MLQLCSDLRMPVAWDKLDGPATTITFLGIELDPHKQVLRLTQQKLQELTIELDLYLTYHISHSFTKRDLLSIMGKLSFAARVVPTGRLFLKCLIYLSTTARKLHHNVCLNSDSTANLNWWKHYLPTWNGVSSFFEPSSIPARDASGSWGLGAFRNGAW